MELTSYSWVTSINQRAWTPQVSGATLMCAPGQSHLISQCHSYCQAHYLVLWTLHPSQAADNLFSLLEREGGKVCDRKLEHKFVNTVAVIESSFSFPVSFCFQYPYGLFRQGRILWQTYSMLFQACSIITCLLVSWLRGHLGGKVPLNIGFLFPLLPFPPSFCFALFLFGMKMEKSL